MAIEYRVGANSGVDEARDWASGLRRGLSCRCPRCGEGRMFGRFLKVKPACETCGLELSGHRADDMPPYVVMMIVGHILVPLVLLADNAEVDWPMWLHMALWPTLTLVLCLALLQPVKGALIGYQWALKMHGFDPEAATRDPALPAPLPDAPAR
ncbi:MAG TPA: DUF983 domain-containing protein [Beijerinckiaceae bacterium]|mgnify:CR=1 FL=1|nr:DUF983 domain-containing protein [Beijerinckiaceae bacterium]